jgi:hypothetical protein
VQQKDVVIEEENTTHTISYEVEVQYTKADGKLSNWLYYTSVASLEEAEAEKAKAEGHETIWATIEFRIVKIESIITRTVIER